MSDKIKAVLFDLDGTLLQVDMYRDFLPAYLKRISGVVADRIPPERFVKKLMAATDAMVRNDDAGRTNREVFIDHFFSDIDEQPDEMMPVFDRFYEEQFDSLRPLTRCEPEARGVVQAAIKGGYDVVVATNPVFPRIAIERRLVWAGVDDLPFTLVTTYENMHYCKPNPNYFREIVDHVGCKPGEALMVGNDVEEDLVAAEVGLKTFLVANEFTVQRNETRKFASTYEGTMAELRGLLENGKL